MNNHFCPREYFNEHVQEETERLTVKNPLEFMLTTYMMERYIGEKDQSILDIGSGPGAYSLYFARKGHPVTSLDIAINELAVLEQASRAEGLGINIVCADAADNYLPGKRFDHIFVMGPLYCMCDERLRIRILQNAVDHLKPGGYLYCSFLTTISQLLDDVRFGPGAVYKKGHIGHVDGLADAVRSGDDFSTSQFHFSSIDGVPELMGRLNIEKVAYFGQRGIFSAAEDKLKDFPKEEKELWVSIAKRLMETKESLYSSEAVMFIGQHKGNVI